MLIASSTGKVNMAQSKVHLAACAQIKKRLCMSNMQVKDKSTFYQNSLKCKILITR